MKEKGFTLINGTLSPAEKLVTTRAYKKLLEIARKTGLMPEDRENLDTHNMDSDDFFETAVWIVNKALQHAYIQGQTDMENEILRAVKKQGYKIEKSKELQKINKEINQ